MSNKGDLIRELVGISKEYEEADQSTMRAFLIIGGCWISSLILILVGDINLQSKWGLFILISALGGVLYLLFELVNHILSLRSNVQKVGAMLSHLLGKEG